MTTQDHKAALLQLADRIERADERFPLAINKDAAVAIREFLATPPAPAEPQVDAVAWIEHHKGGDNLVWDDPGGQRSPLYLAPPPQQSAQGQAIYDAIDILTAEADSLRECHTSGDAKDDWTGEPEAKAEYDRMMRTVEGLRAMTAAQDAAQGGGK